MIRLQKALALSSAFVLATSLALGCGGDDKKYVPKPANSGKAASMPKVPELPKKPKKEGDAYTVWGVTHDLRSRVHREEVDGKKLSIVGYIVKTNLVPCASKDEKDGTKEGCAPECAVHKGGKGDEADCKAPVPTFSIADSKEEKTDVIDVMGWASNYARLYDAIELLDKTPKDKQSEKDFQEKMLDMMWQVPIPNPIPEIGAKVKVTGTYGVTFTKATSGAAANPKYGIMTVETVEYLEQPSKLATLPGMPERKPVN